MGQPWTEHVIYVFRGDDDDANPGGGLVLDANGDLYGTTPVGGKYRKVAVFQLSPPAIADAPWTKTIIHSFGGRGGDGYQPPSGLIADPPGTLYGTTALGGINDGGTVFALHQSAPGVWNEKILYRFPVVGGLLPVPNGNLTFGKDGALFGTTASGGIVTLACHYGCGQIFALYPTANGGIWQGRILYSFQGGADGAEPSGELVRGIDGALYGTTRFGGATSCKKPAIGCGTAFRLVP